jgi:YfiH family protein
MGRWRAFRATFASRFPTVVLGHQVHGTDVRWHEALPPGWLVLEGVDGHATAQAGVLLTVTVADCIPIYLADLQTGAIALLHAGWRGSAGGILPRGVEALSSHAGANPRDIVMHCGVGICGKCYEVGPEVAEQYGRTGTIRLDLRDALHRQAGELGIGEVTISAACSAEDRSHYFSHRASGGKDGRMVAYLGRPRR